MDKNAKMFYSLGQRDGALYNICFLNLKGIKYMLEAMVEMLDKCGDGENFQVKKLKEELAKGTYD